MSVEICKTSIQKLAHETAEIRLRTLEQIESKILRALAHNEEIIFKPGELIKYLIRWFAFQPIAAQDKVLVLIAKILQSSYAKAAIDCLGLERMKREIAKVHMLLKLHRAVHLVVDIQKLLEEYEASVRKYSQAGDIIEISDYDCISIADTISSSDELNPSQRKHDETLTKKDYDVPWSKPSISDFNAMKFVADILKGEDSTQADVQNTLQRLQITIPDYPAEYFLQAPNIFQLLLELFERSNTVCPIEDILGTLNIFQRSLLSHIKMRQKPSAFFKQNYNSVNVKTQMSIPKVCSLLLETAVNYLREHIFEIKNGSVLVFQLISGTIQILQTLSKEQCLLIDWNVIRKLNIIANNLRLSFETDEHPTFNRLNYLIVLFAIQRITDIKGDIDESTEEFKEAILDLPLAEYFPKEYKFLENNLNVDSKLQILLNAKDIFYDAVNMLKNPGNYSDEEVIMKGSNILGTLSIHESITLVEKIFSSILHCVPMYSGNQHLRSVADKLLLQMISVKHEKTKIHIYTKVSMAIKKYFACLMNGETAFSGINNINLIELKVIGVPLSSDLLAEIICFGIESENTAIQRCSEDILSLLLRGKHLFVQNWSHFLEILLPVIPLLQCTTRSTKITTELVKLFDPDERNIPAHDVFRGNLRFLFHPQANVRSEALSRIIYILTSRSDAFRYIPNVMEISDLLPNDLCVQRVPRDVDRIFSGGFFERSTVTNLLGLLKSTDIEPLIRKTTLMQLNVICQDEELNRVVFKEGGYLCSLQALDNSLQKSSQADYPDSVLPAIGILSKILFCDPEFRRELALEDNIYVLLLRAMFLYVNDISVRQDASLCLFLLLFSSFIVGSNRHIEVPRTLANFQLPVKCRLQSSQSFHSQQSELEKTYHSIGDSAMNIKSVNRFIRMLVASIYCDGISNIQKTHLENQKKLDISTELHLTEMDLRLIRATSPHDTLAKFLKAVSNATEHKAIINGLIFIKLNIFLLSGQTIKPNEEEQLIKTFRKYIQMTPTNELDFLLFENVLDLFTVCIESFKVKVFSWIFTALEDLQHPLVALLRNSKIPLRLYQKIHRIIVSVINGKNLTHENSSIIYCNLFEYIFPIAEEFFGKRDLNRARCLLNLMQILSGHQLQLEPKNALQICKKCLHFSIALKSFTQTGSHWQKNCLLIVNNLCSQMPKNSFRLSSNYVKYLSGLGGHNDFQVKTLAWCTLGKLASSAEGCSLLVTELSFLPGGFQACCLSTLLDSSEVPMVRCLAGRLFVDLIKTDLNFERIQQILNKQGFFRIAQDFLEDFHQDTDKISFSNTTKVITCDIVRCYCRICTKLLDLNANFCLELCEKTLMFKLYELVKKIPQTSKPSKSFMAMIGDICSLYTRCYEKNFLFLQRTICRDPEFFHSLCSVIDTDIYNDTSIINLLNLLRVLSEDKTGFQYICENLSIAPTKITTFLASTMNSSLINKPRQRCTFQFTTFMLIRSLRQPTYDHINFVDILETTPATEGGNSSEIIFLEMSKLFSHIFSTKTSKFESMPSPTKVLLCETLAVLLKTSEKARDTARNIKLLEKIINLLNTFLENFNTSCTTFVRRYGDAKKIPIVQHLQLLFSIILNWYSSSSAVLHDEFSIVRLTKVLIQIWPWLAHSADLKIQTLHILAFLSDRSIPVCKNFSVLMSPYPNSILQLVVKIVNFETTKVKASNNVDNSLIETGLRIVMNCCACQEGRIALVKLHILDIFDNLHAFSIKPVKTKSNILILWLQFWELFTRYSEGALCRNINALCMVINKSKEPQLRCLGLRILRNMSFLAANRSALLASTDFMYTVNEVLSHPNDESNYEEKLHVSVTIWKLISGGIKYSSMIKSTRLAKKFKVIHEDLSSLEYEEKNHKQIKGYAKDVFNVIEIILAIINS